MTQGDSKSDDSESDGDASRLDRLAAKGRKMAGGDGGEGESVDVTELPDERQLAFYGVMFAMANVDDEVDRRELFAILELLEGEGLSPQAREELRGYAVRPPPLDDCLEKLAEMSEALRCVAMMNLVDVARADEIVVDAEDAALDRAQEKLDLDDRQRDEIEEFVESTRSS